MFPEDIITGDDIKHTEAIPDDADIVVTHQPPMGILDLSEGTNYGCMFLLARITTISPTYHLFGHVHDSYGMTRIGNTVFSNAAILDEDYRPVNKPRLLDLNKNNIHDMSAQPYAHTYYIIPLHPFLHSLRTPHNARSAAINE